MPSCRKRWMNSRFYGGLSPFAPHAKEFEMTKDIGRRSNRTSANTRTQSFPMAAAKNALKLYPEVTDKIGDL